MEEKVFFFLVEEEKSFGQWVMLWTKTKTKLC